MLKKIVYHLLTKKITIAKWQVNLFGLSVFSIGFVSGFYLLTSQIIVPLISAATTSQTWNFATAGDYTVSDANYIEISANTAKLKASNYTDDANTMFLFHLDETEGSTANDSSSNNNDGTISSGTWTTGKFSNALNLSGSSSGIRITDNSDVSFTGSHTLETWIKFDSSFSADTLASGQTIFDKGSYRLFYNQHTGKIQYELEDSSATTWAQVAGQDSTHGWDAVGFTHIHSQVIYNTNLYIAGGDSTGAADVWKWDGSNWAQVAGDSLNSSWDSSYEAIYALATDGTYLYAGLGNDTDDGEVWRYNGTTWTKIGGDGTNSSWTDADNVENVASLYYQNSKLYAGLGTNNDDIWEWNGNTWTQIGGSGVNSSWNETQDIVESITGDGTNLYVGLGSGTLDAEVWRWSGTAWTKIGGDGVNPGGGTASWNTNYESVKSLTYFGGNLYAGLSASSGDAEVWRWNGTDWTQIGGDSLNSGWLNDYEQVHTLTNNGSTLYAGIGDNGAQGEVWSWNGSTWTQIGGDEINGGFTNPLGGTADRITSLIINGSTIYAAVYDAGRSPQIWQYSSGSWTIIGGYFLNQSWGSNLTDVSSLSTDGDYLYAGLGSTESDGTALVKRYDGTNWTLIAGQGKNSSWNWNNFGTVASLQPFKGKLYAGLGDGTDDAKVWEWNGSTWTQIGGDGEASSWSNTQTNETVRAMAANNNYLFVGLGDGSADADVWQWNSTTWAQIGGDSLNSGWTTANEQVLSMTIFNGNLIVGLGNSASDADVWSWNGSAWTQIGGDTANNWNTGYEKVDSLAVYNNKLYAGIGVTTAEDEVWEWSGSGDTWTKIGGDGINSSWADNVHEEVASLVVYNGKLYAGLGNGADDGEVWSWNGATWSKVGGDGYNSSWPDTPSIDKAMNMAVYKGKLYTGLGASANRDAQVWSYGNNRILTSVANSQNDQWHHIAATYDGSTMKIYIDGVENNSTAATVTMPDNSLNLLIGSSYGGDTSKENTAYFDGTLDELRISDTARTSFISSIYSSNPQTVRPNTAYNPTGLTAWANFTTSETNNGGSIKYRLSNDNGSSWYYWNDTAWATSGSTSQTNTQTDINSHIASFPTGSGIIWQAILQGDGDQQVTLNSVTVTAELDSTAPPVNATAVTVIGAGAGGWVNTEPTISWASGSDNDGGSRILGYCIALDEVNIDSASNTLNPATQAGSVMEVDGSVIDDGVESAACPYIVIGNSVNLANITGLTLTSGKQYYFSIKALDNAGNIFSGSSEDYQDLATFKIDNTAPSNPAYISLPGDFIATKSATLSWPISGGQQASDDASGVAGFQYRIGTSGTWYGDIHNGNQNSTDLLTNDGNYEFTQAYDFANIAEGTNLIQFRTYDNAGNVSSVVITGLLKINTTAPSEPANLTVTPSTNTVNSFAFDWDVPATYSGNIDEFTYCYTVNTLPSATTCNWTAAGVTELTADAYATQPGSNVFYLVSKSDAGTVNYENYASITFTANTSAPSIPQNLDIADVSVKATSSWKLALAWEAPSSLGAGVEYYQVYHSTDNSTFTSESTVYDISYVDTGLSQVTHYYKVRACDSANNCGAFTSAVSLYPDGKYTTSPSLNSGPSASNLTTKKATISWTTSRTSDSKVAYGLKSGSYYDEEPSNSSQVTDHSIKLTNLSPGTTYYYKAKWTDEDGNTGESDEKTFTTNPAPSISAVEATDTGLSSTLITFTVKNAVKAKILYGKTANYGGSQEVTTSTLESTYSIKLEDLDDDSEYHYKLVLLDTENAEYEFEDHVFQTLPRPRISNVQIEEIKGAAQPAVLVSWESNTGISSIINYYPIDNAKETLNQVNIELIKGEHQMLLKNLKAETQYQMYIKGVDKIGNEAVSSLTTFTTATDTRPPVIYNLKISTATQGEGAEAQAQLLISFDTDEESTTQIEFGEGSQETYSHRTQLDTDLTLHHFTIVPNLSPAKVYHLRALTKDKAGNETASIDKVMVTGRATDNALDLVINNLFEIFGFLRK